MKRVLFVLLTLSIATGMYGCNVFDWAEPTTAHFDRCKGLNDKGDYDAAIAECEKADPNEENADVQLELADAHLAALGIRVSALSDVFLNGSSDGLNTILGLAESVIAAKAITIENHDASIIHATKAFDKFRAYGELLSAEDPTGGPEVAAFYDTLAGVSVIAVTMAYADIMPTGNNDGHVDKSDICNPDNPNCKDAQTNMCIDDPNATLGYNGITCEGMLQSDAAVASDALQKLGVNLAALDLPSLESAVNQMVNLSINEPGVGLIKIGNSNYKTDAGRDILRSMAR